VDEIRIPVAGDGIHAARQRAIAEAYERAQFAEEEAGYAELVGEEDAAEYWRIQAHRAERRARRLERSEA
jgi:hypothetical protein